MSADLFAIGSSALRTFRSQMGAISENISNANTDGYSRRTVQIAESPVANTQPLYVERANFGGSVVNGVVRANDTYLDATSRMTGAALGNANARLRWQTDIETALNDDSLGVGSSLSNLYGSIDRLAASPSDQSQRTNMLYSLQQVVSSFQKSSDGLNTTLQGTFSAAQNDVTLVNNSLSELSRINDSLLRSQKGTSNYAQLLDSRDAELSKITQRLNVNVSFAANDTAVLSYNGTTLVQGNTASSLSVAQNTNGTLALSIDGTATTTPADGSLGGLFSSATVARQRLDSLDALAVQFANNMNTWHGQGLTDANAAGGALLTVGTTAASLTVAITDITQVAAKSSDGRLNGNLLNISTVRGSGSVEQGWTALVAAHGNLLATTKSEQSAAQLRDDNAKGARDKVSGVDLDMEAADLLRVQQAYQAAAKVIQSARDVVDTILNLR